MEVLPDDRAFDKNFAWRVMEKTLEKIRQKIH